MPALVAIHGHGGSYLWGKSKVSSSRAKTAAYGYGGRLVRQGYMVLAPDLIAFEERRFDSVVATGPWPDDAERLVFGNLLLNGGTLAGWTLLELSHAIDYLLSREDVDGNRIGVIGHSMGGTLAPLLMLFDRRVQVGVASCGLSTWKAMMARHVIHNYSCYVPGLTESADLDVLLGAIAPRPLMVLAGQQDHNFPPDGVRAMADKLAGAYAAHGAGDALKVHIHDGGHVFDEPLQLQASSFLGRWLSARQSQQAASR